MQVAIGADVDHEIVRVQAAAEAGQDLVAPRARLQRHVDHFGALRASLQPQAISYSSRKGRSVTG